MTNRPSTRNPRTAPPGRDGARDERSHDEAVVRARVLRGSAGQPGSTRHGVERRTTRRVFGAVAGAGALLAGAPAGAAAQAVVQDELRQVVFETPYGLDPVHEFSAGNLRTAGAVEGLLQQTAAGDVTVELAQSFEVLDARRLIVALRPGVAFWSGRPVDARAVVDSLERSRALWPAATTLLKGVRIEPADEWTVLFDAEIAAPGLALNLTNAALVIHNADSYGPQDNAFDVSAADLTGYYRVTSFEPRRLVTLVRHDGYWGLRPRTARMRVEEINDGEGRVLAALSGEAHLIRSITTAGAASVERSRAMRLVTVPSTGPTNVYLNTQRPPLDDARVRQALAWGMDREELVAQAADGRGSATPSWLSPNPLYAEAKKVGYTRTDAARARQLLDEAGWRLPAGGRVRVKDGQPLSIRCVWFFANRPIAEVLQQQWGKLGVQVEVEGASDYGIIQQKRAANDWDSFIEGWGTAGEPKAVLARHVAPDGDLNYMKFRDPQLDALMDGFDSLVDAEERRQQALRVNERHAELVPFIPMFARDSLIAVHRNVRNYTPNPFGSDMHPDLWVAP